MARIKYYNKQTGQWEYADNVLMSGSTSAVEYVEQKLTEEQKEQARENIGAISATAKDNIDMNGFKITNLPLPTTGSEPATKEFVENFTVEGSTYVATDDNNDGNVVLRPYVADVDELEFRVHIKNKENPHGVTKEKIGALGFVGNISDYDYDFNKCIKEGYYQINSLECTNSPVKGFGTLFVMHNVYATQIFFVRGGQVWLRNETDFERLISSSWSRVDSKDSAPAGYVSEKHNFTDYASALAHIKNVYASMNNNEKKCLFVDIANGSAWNREFPSGSYFVEIYREWDNYGIVEFISNAFIKIVIRISGSWGDFCYENPPMEPGVEYRTTERWNGKPIYTMLINCGTMPTAGGTNRIDMPSTIYGWIDRVLRANGSDSSGNSIPYSWHGEYITEVSANRSAIYIYAKDDYSSNTADVQIWYVRHQEG